MHTASERPDLWQRRIAASEVWPEYQTHGEAIVQWWSLLDVEFPDFQFVLYDEDADAVVAQGYAGPIGWDGADDTLPDGFDSTIDRIFRQNRSTERVNTLCALAAEIPRSGRGRGLAARIMVAMRTMAARHGFANLVVPVRPSGKHRYPLTPIERYIEWRRKDGLMFDPWMRVHERLGARTGRALAQSFRVTGTVAEWESWTAMEFPETGDYIFPEGLAPVRIDRDANLGLYWGPNVWMTHSVPRP
jgi:hypothetical protein